MATAKHIINGLKLLSRYTGGADGNCVAADHDLFYAGGPPPEQLPERVRRELEALGWHYEARTESWYRGV